MRRHAAFDSVVRFTPISPRRKLSARRKLLMGLTAAFVLLLALEGVARIVKTIHDDTIVDERDWYVYSAQVGWKPRPHAFDMPYEGRLYFDGGGYSVEDTKKIWAQRGRPRVIGVGDSTMYGYGVATRDTYLERLQERLPQPISSTSPSPATPRATVPGGSSTTPCRSGRRSSWPASTSTTAATC